MVTISFSVLVLVLSIKLLNSSWALKEKTKECEKFRTLAERTRREYETAYWRTEMLKESMAEVINPVLEAAKTVKDVNVSLYPDSGAQTYVRVVLQEPFVNLRSMYITPNTVVKPRMDEVELKDIALSVRLAVLDPPTLPNVKVLRAQLLCCGAKLFADAVEMYVMEEERKAKSNGG